MRGANLYVAYAPYAVSPAVSLDRSHRYLHCTGLVAPGRRPCRRSVVLLLPVSLSVFCPAPRCVPPPLTRWVEGKSSGCLCGLLLVYLTL